MTDTGFAPARLAPAFEVRVSGVTLAADLREQVLSLVVETDLDLAGSFALVLRNADNTLLDSALLDLGKTVEIHLGYGNDLTPAFLGEIAAVAPSFPQDGPPTIKVSGYDKSYRLRRTQPKPAVYKFMNDSLIAARIAAEHGLIPVVDPTPGLAKKTIKAESDWAFLKTRARRYFFDVYVEWDRLHFQFPRPQLAAHVLQWGRNLSSFAPRISSAGLAGLQVIRGYNQELAQTIHVAVLAADLDLDNLVERLGSSALELLQTLVREGIRKHSIDNPLDAEVLARSLLQDLLEGMYEASGSCIGLPDLVAGRFIAIEGVGRRFGGTYRARKVTHTIDTNGFNTSFEVTQRSHSSLMGLLRKQLLEESSPDRPERFDGVIVGTIAETYEPLSDPTEPALGRVKVLIPEFGEDYKTDWAPCARPMAGSGMGFYALPEEGEQVLVAFAKGELKEPYVLGSLWSTEQRPPVIDADEVNRKRMIKSRSGLTITLHDPEGTVDGAEGGGELVVEDGKGSSITLNARDGSVTISARGDLTIKAEGNISLEAAGGDTTISMTATEVDVT
jgi:phage protein D/phage baseplate assembly protein gpV